MMHSNPVFLPAPYQVHQKYGQCRSSIEEEIQNRGLYAGAVGYIGFDRNLEFAIAIRTVIVRNGRAYVQVGQELSQIQSRKMNGRKLKARHQQCCGRLSVQECHHESPDRGLLRQLHLQPVPAGRKTRGQPGCYDLRYPAGTAEKERVRPDHPLTGTGTPRDSGVCPEVLETMSRTIPTLGVCLGHQAICTTFGGEVIRAEHLMHGKTSVIQHDGQGIFTGIPAPFTATRYHSLVAKKDSLPPDLEVSATSLDDHYVMGVRHTRYPIEGVQFHPESILSQEGDRIIRNFLYGKPGA